MLAILTSAFSQKATFKRIVWSHHSTGLSSAGEATEKMPFVREPRKLPIVLNPEEARNLLRARLSSPRQR